MARRKSTQEESPQSDKPDETKVEGEEYRFEAIRGGQFGGFTWRRGDRHTLKKREVPKFLKFVGVVKK